MITGFIFDIKRFSLQDGPGIRTTVFFKGCPLRCFWCHNPESQSAQVELMYHENRCILCSTCIFACSNNAILNVSNKLIYEVNNCVRCGSCISSCVADAREWVGKRVSVEQVVSEVEKDIPFFDQSNGGVTISGGEPLFQPDFLFELLKSLKEKDIHTVVDTSGWQIWDIFDKIRKYVDLFLYDCKIVDRKKHLLYTGVDNQLIIDNLRRLSEHNHPLIVRVPVIPNINDDEENITNTVSLLSRMPKIKRVDLLTYHPLGFGKYAGLGKPLPNTYGLEINQPNNNNERIHRFKYELEKIGLEVHIF